MSRFAALARRTSGVCSRVFGDKVIYETSDGLACHITATLYQNQVDAGLGVGIDSTMTEFGIPFTELKAEPQQGDLITTNAGQTFEVIAPLDMGHGEWRVSVQLVDERHSNEEAAVAGDRI
jgi:hypothetical protein